MVLPMNVFDFVVTPGPQIVTTIIPVGPRPTHMVCPHCHAEILTSTKTTPGKRNICRAMKQV